MFLENKEIAIVGGGPGGLTLARLLQMQNIKVKLYERDADQYVRQQGATLDLHESSGLEALRRAGLLDQFYANYRPEAGKLRILDKDGNIHLDDHIGQSDHAEDRPEIDRGPLRKILLGSLLSDTVVWDSQFIRMEKKNEGWQLYFKNGSTAYADLVVAADGANSKLRPYVTDIQPVYSGITIVEGNVPDALENAPNLWQLVKGGKIFAFGEEQSLILSSKGDGSLSFYTGCKMGENWVQQCGIDFSTKDQVFHWFKSFFSSWSSLWNELFEGEGHWFAPRPQYHFPINQKWISQANLTLLGDAAHRMPPYAGEGVNMAMQDAFTLAAYITDKHSNNMEEAIRGYEKEMLERSSEVTVETLRNTELLHQENALFNLLEIMKG